MKKTMRPLEAAAIVVLMMLTLTGCATLFRSPAGKSAPPPAEKSSADSLEGYVFAYVDGLPGGYHVARVLQPANGDSGDKSEILDMYGSTEKRWAVVFDSHPAEKEELVVGQAVLFQTSGFSDPDKETLIATTWDAYLITDVSDMAAGQVTLRGDIVASVKHLRIPDTEIILY